MWRVENAELIEWLKDYDGKKFHAVFSDPPYGLAFMGKSWDAFKSPLDYQHWVEEWASLLIEKALYPGAVCAFFGGTRTIHRMTCGLEDAGFEVADSVAWLYGEGFPKSHCISKAVDKEAGAEREVVGVGNDKNKTQMFGGNETHPTTITAPATPDAARWSGYGTAIKPSREDAVLVRAPRGDMRYVDLVLRYRTGAINIDGGRIGTSSTPRKDPKNGNLTNAHMEVRPWMRERIENNEPLKGDFDGAQGRWPANVIFSHHPDCTDSACVEGCPVKELGEQSGELTSKWGRQGSIQYGRDFYGSTDRRTTEDIDRGTRAFIGDTGTAARFFYVAKASRAERDAGLSNLPREFLATMGDGIGHREHNKNEPRAYVRNNHICVKPIGITQHISTLLLPPPLDEPRRILVPFAGSGSEMIGALRAGWDEIIGVEMSAEYCEIARARMEYWQEHGVQQSMEL